MTDAKGARCSAGLPRDRRAGNRHGGRRAARVAGHSRCPRRAASWSCWWPGTDGAAHRWPTRRCRAVALGSQSRVRRSVRRRRTAGLPTCSISSTRAGLPSKTAAPIVFDMPAGAHEHGGPRRVVARGERERTARDSARAVCARARPSVQVAFEMPPGDSARDRLPPPGGLPIADRHRRESRARWGCRPRSCRRCASRPTGDGDSWPASGTGAEGRPGASRSTITGIPHHPIGRATSPWRSRSCSSAAVRGPRRRRQAVGRGGGARCWSAARGDLRASCCASRSSGSQEAADRGRPARGARRWSASSRRSTANSMRGPGRPDGPGVRRVTFDFDRVSVAVTCRATTAAAGALSRTCRWNVARARCSVCSGRTERGSRRCCRSWRRCSRRPPARCVTASGRGAIGWCRPSRAPRLPLARPASLPELTARGEPRVLRAAVRPRPRAGAGGARAGARRPVRPRGRRRVGLLARHAAAARARAGAAARAAAAAARRAVHRAGRRLGGGAGRRA